MGGRKPPFSYFHVLGTLGNSKSLGVFTASIFLHEKQVEHKKHTRRPTRPE
jgi:hypothetical protein